MHKTLSFHFISFEIAALPLPLHVDRNLFEDDDVIVVVVFVGCTEPVYPVDLEVKYELEVGRARAYHNSLSQLQGSFFYCTATLVCNLVESVLSSVQGGFSIPGLDTSSGSLYLEPKHDQS